MLNDHDTPPIVPSSVKYLIVFSSLAFLRRSFVQLSLLSPYDAFISTKPRCVSPSTAFTYLFSHPMQTISLLLLLPLAYLFHCSFHRVMHQLVFICKRYVRPWSGKITVLMTASLIQERATGKNKSYDNDIHPGLALVFYQRRWSAKSDKTHEQNMYTCSCFVYSNFLVSPTRDTCLCLKK